MKKILTIFLIFIFVFLFSGIFSANSISYTIVQRGDVDASGKINNKDLGLLMQYINSWNVTNFIVSVADINIDDKVNNKDFGLLMQHINSWEVNLDTNINLYGNEIYGSGTEDDPFLDTPNIKTNILKTFTICSNSSVYYGVYRVVGKQLTIDNPNAYVVYNGTTHTATNGKVSFVITEPKVYIPNSPIVLEIGNTDNAPANFNLIFSDVEGSYELPKTVNVLNKTTTYFEQDNAQSKIYYEYLVTQSGILHFYFDEKIETTKDFIFFVQNNTDITVQRNNSDDLTTIDDDIYEVELTVQKGDRIKIFFSNSKQGRIFPETNIEWYAKYQ